VSVHTPSVLRKRFGDATPLLSIDSGLVTDFGTSPN